MHSDPFHVEQWVDSYPDFSRTSRRNYFRSIKRCLKWAMRQGYIDSNPLEYLEVPSGERKEVVVSEDDFETMLSFVPDDNFRDLLIVSRETGCRPQESLRVEAGTSTYRIVAGFFPSANRRANGPCEPSI